MSKIGSWNNFSSLSVSRIVIILAWKLHSPRNFKCNSKFNLWQWHAIIVQNWLWLYIHFYFKTANFVDKIKVIHFTILRFCFHKHVIHKVCGWKFWMVIPYCWLSLSTTQPSHQTMICQSRRVIWNIFQQIKYILLCKHRLDNNFQ